MMKGTGAMFVSAVLMAGSLLILGGPSAVADPHFDSKIKPGKYENYPILIDEPSLEIKVSSDIPVDVYVMTDEQYVEFESTGVPEDTEREYPGVSTKTFRYSTEGNNEIQWVVVINSGPLLTANVTVDIRTVDDTGISGACCGSAILIGAVPLATIISLVYVMKRI